MSVTSLDEAKRRSWRVGLIVAGKNKTPRKCLANTLHVLATHPAWAGVIAFDAFAEVPVLLKEPPTRAQDRPSGTLIGDWTEQDTVRTAAWISTEVGFDPSIEMVEQAMLAVARKSPFHPVRDHLEALRWDATQRLPKLLTRYFGADDTPYTSAIGIRFLISAVARVYIPGCQADSMLVLESERQGVGKSTAIRVLAGDWYADTGITVGDKDSYQSLRRIWIYEFAELAAIRGKESERVKNFVSSRQDHYRPSYGRRTRDFPRQCVFVGSTNEREYLVDRTGNRRYWPVRCPKIDLEALRRDRDQLWAEALARFKSNEAWHIDQAELAKLCEAEQASRQAPDDWVPIVAAWLKHPTLPDGHGERRIADLTEGVTTADVLLGAVGMRAAEMNNGSSTRAGHVLRELGFAPTPNAVRRDGQRVRLYRKADDTADTADATGCAGKGVSPERQQGGSISS